MKLHHFPPTNRASVLQEESTKKVWNLNEGHRETLIKASWFANDRNFSVVERTTDITQARVERQLPRSYSNLKTSFF